MSDTTTGGIGEELLRWAGSADSSEVGCWAEVQCGVHNYCIPRELGVEGQYEYMHYCEYKSN